MVRYEAWRSRTFARRDLFGVLAAIDEPALAAPDAATSRCGARASGSMARIWMMPVVASSSG